LSRKESQRDGRRGGADGPGYRAPNPITELDGHTPELGTPGRPLKKKTTAASRAGGAGRRQCL